MIFRPGTFSRIPARYQANIIVTHKPNSGVPVIFEDFSNPLQFIGACGTTHAKWHHHH